jgi:hypothetical protein
MSMLELMRSQWDSRPQHEVEVTELHQGGKPVVFFFKAPNAATLSKVLRESKGDMIEQAVLVFIHCVTDANGKRLFNTADKTELMQHVDFSIVNRVAAEIMKLAKLDVGEAEKNLEATPSE